MKVLLKFDTFSDIYHRDANNNKILTKQYEEKKNEEE